MFNLEINHQILNFYNDKFDDIQFIKPTKNPRNIFSPFVMCVGRKENGASIYIKDYDMTCVSRDAKIFTCVVTDYAVNNLTSLELMAVLNHEIGHVRMNHFYQKETGSARQEMEADLYAIHELKSSPLDLSSGLMKIATKIKTNGTSFLERLFNPSIMELDPEIKARIETMFL